jgi:predicted nucleic acid-binding protein
MADIAFLDANVFMYAAGISHPYKSPCLHVLSDLETGVLAIDLFDLHRASGLKVRDAIHAATMRNHSIARLISADQDFDCLEFVTRIDPLAYQAA